LKYLLLLLSLSSMVWSSDYVNILVYHHVSENTPASTSISPERFKAHLQLFKDEGFTVIDLNEAIKALQNHETLPDHSIAITFDDGYHDIYENAYPLLKEFDYPFTLFVATDPIDDHYSDMLNWDQLREMQNNGVIIANHSADHDYLVRHRKHDSAWQQATQANIIKAQQRLNAELDNNVPNWFAYPYGEFSEGLTTLLKDMNFIGFAQHSGGAWSGSNWQALPRFAAAGIYANPKTLLTKIKSHPMPVNESLLADMLTSESQPILNASLLTTEDQSKALNCFVNGGWTEPSRPAPDEFQLQSNEPLAQGRHRYNCTAKSLSGDYYYWFSKPWLIYSITDQR
jgi:peptidoglycan/xylan/chitin deacetylase (PgdA/CDA1 family)